MSDKHLRHVSRACPCQVCTWKDGCSFTNDGLIMCRRRKGNQSGFRWLGASKNPEWHLYRLENDDTRPGQDWRTRTPPFFSSSSPPSAVDIPNIDWGIEAIGYSWFMTEERAESLATELRLPVAALNALPLIGWDTVNRRYTFPESDALGRIVGLFLRGETGWKGVMKGSKRGLYFPKNWMEGPGAIRIVEGASDVLALALMGLPVIGRPSAKAGVDLLIELLKTSDKPIVVVGENDKKDNASWPGKEGADFIAEQLRAALLGRPVKVTYPPPDCKDARDWVVRHGFRLHAT